jgi:hypothetical protein
MACDCIDRVDAALKERNRRIDIALYLDARPPRAIVPMLVIEKKRGERPGHIVADFCPFCGVKYQEGEQ